MSGPHRSFDPLLVALLGVVATLPVLLPGGEVYIDNAPHLLTVTALADEALPHDHWWTGWTELAELGMPAVQVNGPLVWTALGGLVWAGLPAIPTYLAAIALGNAALALGCWSLGRALLPGRLAPLLVAGLAACATADLYGIGGAAGGMWPYRLANGLLLAGLAPAWRRPGLAWLAPWLAAVVMCHTFSGVVAHAWVGLLAAAAFAAGRKADARQLVAGLALGVALSAAFWLPLLTPGVRDAFVPPVRWGPLWTLAFLAAPLDPFELQVFDHYRLIGGGWGAVPAELALVGTIAAVGSARGRAMLAETGTIGRLAAGGLAALVVVLAIVVPLTGWAGLGPNPWRFYAFWRIALAVVGGLGLSLVVERARGWGALAVLGLAAAGAVRAGLTEVPRRGEPPTAALFSDLETVWAAVAAARPGSLVYHEDSSQDPEAPEALQDTHVGALYPLLHGGSVLGSWYGVTSVQSHVWTSSEAIFVMGLTPEQLAEQPRLAGDRLGLFGCEAVVTVSRRLPTALRGDARFEQVAQAGPFTGWVLRKPPLPVLGVPATAGRVQRLAVSRGRVEAIVASSGGAVPFRLRRSWHPWWRATWEGQPVALHAGDQSGLVEGEVPGSGKLLLEWRDRGAAGRWLSLLGLLAWAGVAQRGRGSRGGPDG